MVDDPIELCPTCDSPVVRLIGSGAGIIFKGSGFYATDYPKSVVPPGETKQEKQDVASE